MGKNETFSVKSPQLIVLIALCARDLVGQVDFQITWGISKTCIDPYISIYMGKNTLPQSVPLQKCWYSNLLYFWKYCSSVVCGPILIFKSAFWKDVYLLSSGGWSWADSWHWHARRRFNHSGIPQLVHVSSLACTLWVDYYKQILPNYHKICLSWFLMGELCTCHTSE